MATQLQFRRPPRRSPLSLRRTSWPRAIRRGRRPRRAGPGNRAALRPGLAAARPRAGEFGGGGRWPDLRDAAVRAYACALDIDPDDTLGVRAHLSRLGSGTAAGLPPPMCGPCSTATRHASSATWSGADLYRSGTGQRRPPPEPGFSPGPRPGLRHGPDGRGDPRAGRSPHGRRSTPGRWRWHGPSHGRAGRSMTALPRANRPRSWRTGGGLRRSLPRRRRPDLRGGSRPRPGRDGPRAAAGRPRRLHGAVPRRTGAALGADGRYAHADAHIAGGRRDAGLSTPHPAPSRGPAEAGRPVPGRVVVLRRTRHETA